MPGDCNFLSLLCRIKVFIKKIKFLTNDNTRKKTNSKETFHGYDGIDLPKNTPK